MICYATMELPEKIKEADMETLRKIRRLFGMENDI
jgi:hypothetical protein